VRLCEKVTELPSRHLRALTGAEGTTSFLPKLVGLRRALERVLLNRRLAAAEAYTLGLRAVYETDEFAMRVAALARAMKQETMHLVQEPWKKVETMAPQAGALFYHHLFSADPHLKALFKGDMEAQGQKLMKMIGLAVGRLDELHEIGPVLQNLAKRHVEYGVQASHYATVGAALIKTLGQGLGEDFTPAVQGERSPAETMHRMQSRHRVGKTHVRLRLREMTT
jgi:hemoglobin-like flavoprotein